MLEMKRNIRPKKLKLITKECVRIPFVGLIAHMYISLICILFNYPGMHV